jgi:voltage-gated potassium channel
LLNIRQVDKTGKRKIITAIILLCIIIVMGVTGYMIIEGDDFLTALYMTIITISTVGFGEIHKLSPTGRVFTIILILSSFGTYAYAISIITKHIVEGQLAGFFAGVGRKNSKARKMDNHIIICGFGRNGQQAAYELVAHHQPFVIVESNHDEILRHMDKDFIFVEGDATNDDVLEKANIAKARALITTLPNDADNTYVTLTARAMNKDLMIISRATSESSEKKLKVAGANNVIMPERVGGAHMATLVARPDVMEFLENLSVQGKAPTNLEEIVCSELTRDLSAKNIAQLGIREKSGANIIGLKTPEGEFVLNPSSDYKVTRGTKLFVLATPGQVKKLKQIIREG